MRARRSVWTDAAVQELLSEFVTVADEVGRLQRGGNAESDVFLGFCEEGHYGGRTWPTGTRQGIYAVTPAGRFLASVNTTSSTKMAEMLRTALERWRVLPAVDRQLGDEDKERLAGSARFEDRYPTDGLVLAQYSRDLDSRLELPGLDWLAKAWNEDQVWFTHAEAESFVPAKIAIGERGELPATLVERLACLHLVDNVRGQTPAYRREDLVEGWLRTEVVAVDGERVRLRFTGKTMTEQKGKWRVRDSRGDAVDHERGVRCELQGHAVWDSKGGRFVAFELLAIGERWGATQYNGRPEDLTPTAVGFAFVLAGEDHPKVAPAFWWRYGWR